MSGSPLFSGGAGSGESEIRRYLLENDLVEAIVAMPGDMFYNTSIGSYVWMLSNKKPAHKKGKVQLIDASNMGAKVRKTLGNKRQELTEAIQDIIEELFVKFCEAKLVSVTEQEEGKTTRGIILEGEEIPVAEKGQKITIAPVSRIFRNEEFGYHTITIERPLLDDNGQVVLSAKGKLKGRPMVNPSLRDTENVPLSQSIEDYFENEVIPHAPDAWIDHDKTKVGYEISFNQYFHVSEPSRPLKVINEELLKLADEILNGLAGMES
jgi:type I restriction enzyme M protein